MSAYSFALRAFLGAGIAVLFASSSAAQNGTWTNPAGGSWAAPGNWLGNTIANGSGNTANFGTLDITNDVNVTLDGSRTIGNLIFNDTPTPTNNWFLAPGTPANGVLTLAAGSQPSINVSNTIATISLTLGGTQGIILSGNGTLNLTGDNVISGPIEVQAGSRMRVNNTGGSGTGSGNVTVRGGGKLNGAGNIDGGVTVDAGGTVAPGNSAGTLHVGAANVNGIYEFELTGTNYAPAGFNSGGSTNLTFQDLLDVTNGNLNLSGSARVNVIFGGGSLDPQQTYSWAIASVPASGDITVANPFAIDISLAPFFSTGNVQLSINNATKTLNLNYTPVPEPTGVFALAGFSWLVGARIRRRLRRVV